jgi:GTP-binding protein
MSGAPFLLSLKVTIMKLRNIAIIAHVDHGKTTLVDQLLKQSGAFRANQQVMERVMDSNDLERERGITILAKCTSVDWKGTRINIVDTPGHADFGGEVERILNMVDGVILLVDAAEGPLPQTKFVTMKALALGLRPIVVINKCDRPDAQPHETHDMVFDLFAVLGAEDEQLDFPTLFASSRQGWAVANLEADERKDLSPLFDLVVDHVPSPRVQNDAPFSMLVTTLEYDNYLGRVLTGRIQTGKALVNMPVRAIQPDGNIVETARLTKLLSFRGIERVPVEEAEAGDIVAIAGLTDTTVADSICDPVVEIPLPAQPIDPPTLAMTFSVNDSPLAGREGDKVTSRMIGTRLSREAEGNVAIKVKETEGRDAYEVAGRGELQLGVLVETMRREGFELSISRPRVLYRQDPATGERTEPIEEAVIDVDEEFTGVVIDKLGQRRGVVHVPTRGLIGYHGEFLTDTRGTGIMSRLFHGYGPYRGPIAGRRNGVLISNAEGATVAYALWYLEERGDLFVNPGEAIYEGMIIGENSRGHDLEVNPLKSKQLTNIRTTSKDEAIRLTPPRAITLEYAMSYIEDDERVEVTPKSIRLRKAILNPHDRKKAEKRAEAETA